MNFKSSTVIAALLLLLHKITKALILKYQSLFIVKNLSAIW